MKVVYSKEAKADILEIVVYYEEQQVGLAEHFLGSLAGTVERARLYPEQFREIDSGVRRAVFPRPFRYNLYYRPEPEAGQLIVLAVVHQARDPQAWKRGRSG